MVIYSATGTRYHESGLWVRDSLGRLTFGSFIGFGARVGRQTQEANLTDLFKLMNLVLASRTLEGQAV